MSRTLDQMPQEHQTDVASLRALRQAAGKAQADIATALRIKQPSVSKIENQLDMHLSTLRSYVEAIGGELDLIVRLPTRAPMRLHRLGDVCDTELAADRSHTAGSVPVKRDSVKRDTVKRASSRT